MAEGDISPRQQPQAHHPSPQPNPNYNHHQQAPHPSHVYRPRTDRDAHKYLNHSRIGQYEIIKTIGEGSFGKVKLATHVHTQQKVALKIMKRSQLKSQDMKGRVDREIAYLQLLRHPHIIKLYVPAEFGGLCGGGGGGVVPLADAVLSD